MGLIRQTVSDTLKAVLPARTTAVAATVPAGTSGVPQYPEWNYEAFAREGYGKNEIVYACIEELATSAAEPAWVGKRRTGSSRKLETVDTHPLIDLVERPNPFIDRTDFIAGLVMYRAIAGNAYIEKVRNRLGEVVELWLLRPDRVWIIPDEDRFISGYQYRIGNFSHTYDPSDIIHIKNRHPWNDFYGLPPLAAAAGRIDTDNWMRQFTASFFQNAGVPAGLLTFIQRLGEEEKALIKRKFRGDYGGPAGWNSLMVVDGQGKDSAATYTPMGMPLGERGLVLPELDEIDESRIAMVLRVPLSIVGSRLGMASSSYANRKSDREELWENTLVPMYRSFGAALTRGLASEYDDIDAIEPDMHDVRALAEDQDKLHERVRADFAAGLVTREEARLDLGKPETPAKRGIYLVPASLVPVDTDEANEVPEPEPVPAALLTGGAPNTDPDADPNDPNAKRPNLRVVPDAAAERQVKQWSERLSVKADGHTGVIACLVPAAATANRLALPITTDGRVPAPELHLTLAYLGNLGSDISAADALTAARALAVFAKSAMPLAGQTSGVGRFRTGPTGGDEPDAVYLPIDIPALPEWRQRLVATLEAAGLTINREHGFTPHMTVAYVPQASPLPPVWMDPVDLAFDAVWLWAGDDRIAFPLGSGGMPLLAEGEAGSVLEVMASRNGTH